MTKLKSDKLSSTDIKKPYMLFGGILVFIGVALLALSFAATHQGYLEAEEGSISGDCVNVINDSSAAGGQAVEFNCSGNNSSLVGAQLPIQYDLNSISGNKIFIATNGNDSSGNGSESSPYKTVAKALSVGQNGDNVIVRGGNYHEGSIQTSYSRSIDIRAYPGEIPTFNGAKSANSGWVTEGSNKYISYSPMPVTNGSGINFIGGQNLTGDGVGKYPDQAWVGDKELRQVTLISDLNNHTFYVDSASNRLYLTASNANSSQVEVSELRRFLKIRASDVSVEGIRIIRYSNTADDYGVVHIEAVADNSKLENVEIIDAAFSTVQYAGGSDLNENGLLKNATLDSGNWMGVAALYTDYLTLDSVRITNMNDFSEFTTSPQSGALKTSRTWYTKVVNSDISNNRSHALWFDQSNYKTEVAGNNIVDNSGSSIFFEISDDLLLINNYIKASIGSAQPVKLAGSSGLKLINNTIVGGKDPIGIYVDNRSKPGCSNPSQPLCTPGYSSDRDSVRNIPDTLDWIPRLDLMINNIIAYPQAAQFCGGLTDVCITKSNAGAVVPIEQIIHKAESARGIPQTFIDGNVYANGTSHIIRTADGNYTTPAQFTNAMAGAPVNISGLDANSKHGNNWVGPGGSPTLSLANAHSEAVSIPNDATINQYIPAGTRFYGVLSQK